MHNFLFSNSLRKKVVIFALLEPVEDTPSNKKTENGLNGSHFTLPHLEILFLNPRLLQR